ncbi:response regulator [Galactobacter caseinivorans]|uniref:DNA-binding response regulator n=1 Tax=Galactobacter caseinivorans TaxID=2676123 RepID=A0A496PJ24_9MICC|nr:response regulator transcription factor [Galactobacter caseinivorans]RKW70458.1 DNA-binding response regulator [Galactobacter caseinivorans]
MSTQPGHAAQGITATDAPADASGVPAAPARILVVDDQPLFAQGLTLVLNAQAHVEVVGQASNGTEALELIAELRPDAVLLDLRMPGMSGLQVLARLREGGDLTPVVVLTTLRHERAVYEALHRGAAAFLTKDAPPALLLETLGRVLDGDTAVGAPELRRVLEKHGADLPLPAPLLPELTERERAVFLLCARGLSNQEIAESEYVTLATVKSQVSAILRKLGLASRVQLAVYAYENHITRPALDGD